MIQLPRRSVTRFFIPLIDVLTLLFCIFLLMPLIKNPDSGPDQAGPSSTAEGTTTTPMLESEPKGSAADKDKGVPLQQRLFVRVLEIDADTGKLFYQEGDQRQEIESQAAALSLIRAHQQEAGNRELYYLFLYPRRLTGYPQAKQMAQYKSWFKSVPFGIDNPLGSG
jgi:hypothetical protein